MGNGGAYGEQPPDSVVDKMKEKPGDEMGDMGDALDQTDREDETPGNPEPKGPGPA